MTETDKPAVLVLASTYPRWANDSEPGFVHELCKRLSEHFHIIALVPDSPGADANGMLDGVEVIRYAYAPRPWQTLAHSGGIVINLRRHRWKWALLPGFVLAQYFAARRILRQRKIAAIHAHWLLPQGLIARRLARRFAVPYVVTSHGGDLFGLRGRLATFLKRLVVRDCAAMTVVSSAMRDEVTRLGLNPPVIEVLPMGVDLHDRFVPDPQRVRATDELLFVGRIVPKKGLRHLLDALPLVLAQRPQVKFTIAGYGPDVELLQEQARRLGIQGAIVFMGAIAQRDLPELYCRASVFVAPFVRDESGDQEGLPVALMEAIGCGCPVVVGEVAGITDLLGDAAGDICVPATDTARLAENILRTLQHPRAAQERVLALREVIAAKVDWQRIADGYIDVLQMCIKQHK